MGNGFFVIIRVGLLGVVNRNQCQNRVRKILTADVHDNVDRHLLLVYISHSQRFLL